LGLLLIMFLFRKTGPGGLRPKQAPRSEFRVLETMKF
jgi:hypothetical protein